LRTRGITGLEKANEFLRQYVKELNARFRGCGKTRWIA